MNPHATPLKGESFSTIVHRIREQASADGLTLGELIELFGPKGHSVVVLFLVLPFLQPIPLPGLSTAIGSTIALVGIFMVCNRPPWVPKRLARLKLESHVVLRIAAGLEDLLKRMERFIKPRGRALLNFVWFRRINGILLTVHALILAIPLPIPFSNFFPAAVLLFLALGTIEEDLYIIVTAYGAAVLNAVYFALLVFLPALSVRMMS